MPDTIYGVAREIIDGDTFDFFMRSFDSENEHDYDNFERVRIRNIDAPELSESAGATAKEVLARTLSEKELKCVVYSRDAYDRLVCDVFIVGTALRSQG